MKKLILLALLLTACASDSKILNLAGYKFEFTETQQENNIKFEMDAMTNKIETGLNIQGQILNEQHKDIYYAEAKELKPGTYSFEWTPQQTGKYYVQYLFRALNTTLKPTFPITVDAEYPEQTQTTMHWHSQLNITICGKEYTLPKEKGNLNGQHTHLEPNKLHIHAMQENEPSLQLGEIFQELNITFTNECILEYCNGDACPEKEGKLTMKVNGQQNTEYQNYQWKDGDNITLEYK